MTSLVDVGDYSAFQPSEVDPEDPAILLSLDAASDAVRRYCNRAFDQSEATLTLKGTGTDTLLIPNPPLTTVEVTEVWGESETELVGDTDYIVAETAGAIIRIGKIWYPSALYEVAYESGYATIPADVQMAVIRIASRLVASSGGSNAGEVESVTIGTFSETYSTSASTSLTSDEMGLVDSYRLVGVR